MGKEKVGNMSPTLYLGFCFQIFDTLFVQLKNTKNIVIYEDKLEAGP